MNNILISSIAGIFAVSGAIGILAYYKRVELKKKLQSASEIIDSELQMEDIVSYLRCLNLDTKEDTPFMADCNSKKVKKITHGCLEPKPGYKLIMVGVFNDKSNKITHYKFIYAHSWSEKLTQTMGEDSFVVLK